MNFYFNFTCALITFILGMVVVAFFILSERKILGYIQLRKGPNKVGFKGFIQSFADFIKLLNKGYVSSFSIHSWFSWMGVLLMFASCLGYCSLVSLFHLGCDSQWSLLWLVIISSISGYSVLSVGWGSDNKFALMSVVRCCFGAVSFEAVLMCLVINSSLLGVDYSAFPLLDNNWLLSFVLPLFFISWLGSLLYESGRPPFDYLEAESEMVSGFNVEYCSIPFTCLFAFEYYILYMMSWLTSVFFFLVAIV